MKDFNFTIPDIHVMPDVDIPSINMVVVTSSARSGLMVENITPQLGAFFGVKNGDGVLIRSVEKGSRAEKAGFRAGDVIVKVNDQAVHDTSDFTHAVKERIGNSVSVGVVRDKKEQNLNLALPEKKEKESGDLIEEDDDSAIDLESQIELGNLRDQIAKLRPQIELTTENARKAAREMRESLCAHQHELRRQAEKLRQQIRPEEERLKNRIDRLRQELSGNWIEL
jgi:membrane-associated protease RseP (regulator of RpoE activity)